MRIYSNLKINYFLLIEYIPKLYDVSKTYFYYKSQPDLTQEYE